MENCWNPAQVYYLQFGNLKFHNSYENCYHVILLWGKETFINIGRVNIDLKSRLFDDENQDT